MVFGLPLGKFTIGTIDKNNQFTMSKGSIDAPLTRRVDWPIVGLLSITFPTGLIDLL